MKKPRKPPEDLQAAIQAAWRLVETEGLKKEAFDRASTECVKDALWLIANGEPIRAVIATMNEAAQAGAAELRAMRLRKEGELTRSVNAAHPPRGVDRALAAADLASLLARLDLQSMLAELSAFLLTEDNGDRVKLAFLEILRLHGALRRGKHPNAKRAAINLMKPRELEAAYFDALNTSGIVREIVGDATIKDWLRDR